FELIAAREPGSENPRRMPARSMSQAALSLTGDSGASGSRIQCGASSGSARAKFSVTIGFVKKEPALTESGSAGSSTMPLDARSGGEAERLGEMVVGEGCAERARLEPEIEGEHDTVSTALERGRPVAELEVGCRKPLTLARLRVEELDGVEDLGELLTVGADV